MQAGDMYNQRYSKLSQINTGNVGKMAGGVDLPTGVLRGHEGSPLVIGDMMYIHSAFPNKVFAMDLNTQTIKWKYEPKQDPAVIPQMCCARGNRRRGPMRKARSSCSRLTARWWPLDAGTGR